MRAIHHKVNIVPVIAKADMLTKGEVFRLKRRVRVPVSHVIICHSCNYVAGVVLT